MTHETFREMLPLYVVGALDGDELYNFERYVAENRERCNAEIAEFQAIADQIALAVPPAQPSPALYQRIAAAMGEGKRPADAPVPARQAVAPRREREGFNLGTFIFRFVPWAAAAVFAVMVIGANSQIRERDRLLQSLTGSYNEQEGTLAQQKSSLADLTARLDTRTGESKELKEKVEQLQATNDEQKHGLETLRTANKELTEEKDGLLRAADQMREQLERQGLQTAALQKRIDEQAGSLDFLMDPAIRVAQLVADPKAQTKAVAKVYWHGTKKTGFMAVSNFAPVPQGKGKCLELWAICGNDPPVPAGIGWTDDTGHGVLQVKLAKEMTCIDKFAVTVERAEGVPTPEGSIILIGQ